MDESPRDGELTPELFSNVDRATLRRQVLEIISDVLADSDPKKAWAREQLLDLLAAHMDDPEQALLHHLISTRNVPDSSHEEETSEHVPRMLLTAFQPIRLLASGEVIGVEALSRFVSHEGTSADVWFRGAADLGLGPDLEIAALHLALAAAGEIPEQLFASFNLSPAACADPRVQALMLGGAVAPDRMVIEIMGDIADRELSALAEVLSPLRQHGVRLAVDGSGPAATSAKQILHLLPDIIKVDREFLCGAAAAGDGPPTAPFVFALAEQTGATLSAEGIETREELSAVMEQGITRGQGYLLGRPSVDPRDWAAWTGDPEPVEDRE
ncbi:EAL domain-containing protein [Arthrobacter sp. NPDC057388]|jgi:EAL domain-containing protein (putative c-di-GMP-specific phosphodiesterase class I)|uniref:EAL domain-containing protein n=1 Tax=Arthrobacter sp. NPDC057388 TaxID=3346116 RepID=UPI003644E3AA